MDSGVKSVDFKDFHKTYTYVSMKKSKKKIFKFMPDDSYYKL